MKVNRRFVFEGDDFDYPPVIQVYRYSRPKKSRRAQFLLVLSILGTIGVGTAGSVVTMAFLTRPPKVIHLPKLDNQPIVPKPKRERWMPPQYMDGIKDK